MRRWNQFLSKHFRKKGYPEEYLKLRAEEYNVSLLKAIVNVFLFTVVISAFMFLPYFDMKTKFSNIYLGGVSNIYEGNSIVIPIAEVCKNFENEEKQIRCVHNFVNEFFYYDEHKYEIKIFRIPSELINNGGCCRDYTIFYRAIFSLMGYESEFIQEPNHVYLRVFGEERNYIVDQTMLVIEARVIPNDHLKIFESGEEITYKQIKKCEGGYLCKERPECCLRHYFEEEKLTIEWLYKNCRLVLCNPGEECQESGTIDEGAHIRHKCGEYNVEVVKNGYLR